MPHGLSPSPSEWLLSKWHVFRNLLHDIKCTGPVAWLSIQAADHEIKDGRRTMLWDPARHTDYEQGDQQARFCLISFTKLLCLYAG